MADTCQYPINTLSISSYQYLVNLPRQHTLSPPSPSPHPHPPSPALNQHILSPPSPSSTLSCTQPTHPLLTLTFSSPSPHPHPLLTLTLSSPSPSPHPHPLNTFTLSCTQPTHPLTTFTLSPPSPSFPALNQHIHIKTLIHTRGQGVPTMTELAYAQEVGLG